MPGVDIDFGVDLGGQDLLVSGHLTDLHETLTLPVRLLAGLTQSGKNQFPVRVIPKDGLPPVATIHHVINPSCIFDPYFPRHAPKHAQTRALCQYVGLTRMALR